MSWLKNKQQAIKQMDTSSFTFLEFDLNSEISLKSPAWKYFLRDPKNQEAKCKICQAIVKAERSTSGLVKHLNKVHNIELKTEEN